MTTFHEATTSPASLTLDTEASVFLQSPTNKAQAFVRERNSISKVPRPHRAEDHTALRSQGRLKPPREARHTRVPRPESALVCPGLAGYLFSARLQG